jgi:Universal stress protein family
VVVAVSLTPESAAALTWAIQNLCRKGDAVHIVHVVTCLSTPSEVRRCDPAHGVLISCAAPAVATLAVAIVACRRH